MAAKNPGSGMGLKLAPLVAVLGEMGEAADAVNDLLDDLVVYESLQHVTLVLSRETINPVSLILSSFEVYQSLALQRDVALEVLKAGKEDTELSKAFINIDRKKLELAFRPFLLSAILGGQPQKKVCLDLAIIDGDRRVERGVFRKRSMMVHTEITMKVRFIVRDSDCAFTRAEVLEQLGNASFERRARIEGIGSSLGWYLSQRIVDLHEGTIEVCSEECNGVRSMLYWIDFPMSVFKDPEKESDIASLIDLLSLKPQNDEPYPDDRYSSSDDDEAKRTPQMRLLIVDDSRLNRTMVRRIMEGIGHSCEEACDGTEAVDMVRATFPCLGVVPNLPFDAIVMDNQMPLMKGCDAVKILRSIGYDGMVIGLTGNARQADQDEFVGNGADLVLIKPMTVRNFQSAVHKISNQGKKSLATITSDSRLSIGRKYR
jgi:CheY-like chemotaxis protein